MNGSRGGSGKGSRHASVGVALSATELCATTISGGRHAAEGMLRIPLEPPAADGSAWPSLAAALAEVSSAMGVGTLTVALMHPLTEVRRLELPPLREDEMQRILSRNAGKYFVNAKGPQLIGVTPGARRSRGTPVPVVAASAPARLVSTVHAAAREAGLTLGDVMPAESSWASAASELWPAHSRGAGHLLVAQNDRIDLLELQSGRLAGLRRFRPGTTDGALIADAIGSADRAPRVAVVGSEGARREIVRALSERGVTITLPTSAGSARDSAEVIAARYARADFGPVFRGEEASAARRAAARRAITMVAAAAMIMVFAGAGLQLWGLHHQLGIVRAEREQLRPQLAATLVGRTTVAQAYQHLSTLAAFERESPQLTRVIMAVTEHLPDDAYLTGLRTRGDSLVIEGLADRAARVFDAIERTPGLADVRAAAPVRREMIEGEGARERFTIAAQIRQSATSPVAIPASSGVAASPRAGQ